MLLCDIYLNPKHAAQIDAAAVTTMKFVTQTLGLNRNDLVAPLRSKLEISEKSLAETRDLPNPPKEKQQQKRLKRS